MVNRCANPTCCAELKVFNTGELYALERRFSGTEFFWLCPACVPELTLSLDSEGRMSVTPRSDRERWHPPHPDHYLRLISRAAEHTPWLQASRTRGLAMPGKFRQDPLSSSCEAA